MMMRRNTVVGLSMAAMIVSAVAIAPIANAFTGQTTRVSVNSLGVPANMPVASGVLSANGRYVVFWSPATNLRAGLTTSGVHVYRHDRQTGATVLVSVTPSGDPGNSVSRDPSVSGDGRFVVFSSFATDLVPGGTNGLSQVFVRDMLSSTTSLVSADASGTQGNLGSGLSGLSGAHEVSDDGRYVAFTSTATNLITSTNNGVQQVYVKDTATGAIVRASVNDAGEAGNVNSDTPSISGNGQFVAFRSGSTNFVPGSNTSQVFVRALGVPGATTLESPAAAAAGRISNAPSISFDGRYLAFVSEGRLDPLDLDNGTPDVYLRDRDAGTTALASLSPNMVFGAASGSPAISSDGRWVAFSSIDEIMVAPDTNGIVADVFLYDRDARAVTIVSRNDAGDQATAASNGASLSFDGGLVLFSSAASNLVTSPPSTGTQLYVRILSANQAPVVNAGPDETVAEGTSLARTGSFTDLDASTTWTATVDYGAGPVALPLAPDKTFSLAHGPFPVGTHVITVAVTDDPPAGLTGVDTFTYTVTNVPPLVSLPTSLDLAFSRTIDTGGSFTDPGSVSGETYSATVDYGDGTPPQSLALVGGSFTLHHTYASAGTYNVLVTVSDNNGASTTATLVARVGAYSYEFLDPVASSFVIGRNLPVKFVVRGPNGAPVFDPTVRVDVVDEADTTKAGPYTFGDQPSRSVTWSGDSYHVNIDTRTLAPGMYWLRVQFSSPTLTGEFRLGTNGSVSSLRSRAG